MERVYLKDVKVNQKFKWHGEWARRVDLRSINICTRYRSMLKQDQSFQHHLYRLLQEGYLILTYDNDGFYDYEGSDTIVYVEDNPFGDQVQLLTNNSYENRPTICE